MDQLAAQQAKQNNNYDNANFLRVKCLEAKTLQKRRGGKLTDNEQKSIN